MSVPARAEILELITELAARLGRAPGRKLFADETGITESMWVTYWPRWSDALVDAGLTPNELQAAIPDDELLEHLARLVRHLGKWPTFNEMRTVVRSDDSYPSFNTLTRLGSKPEMLRRLHGFAEARPEWHDVQALLPDAPPTPDTTPDKTEPVSAVGYVYLVKSGRHYKIGRTKRRRQTHVRDPATAARASTAHPSDRDRRPGGHRALLAWPLRRSPGQRRVVPTHIDRRRGLQEAQVQVTARSVVPTTCREQPTPAGHSGQHGII